MTPSAPTARFSLGLAIAALALAGYAVWRIDTVRDSEAATAQRVRQLEQERDEMRAKLAAQIELENTARAALQAQWRELANLPQQVRDLTAAHEDLRSRTERPQRAWSRAEAAYLLELAQRRLQFDRDVPTAIIALEAADSRLASMRDPAFDAARREIAKDLQALRAVSSPDRAGVMARLAGIESQVHTLPLKGVPVGQRLESEPGEAKSLLERTRRSIAGFFARFFVVHRLEGESARIVSLEAQSLRRQHLASLLYDARHAVLLNDARTYRSALEAIVSWLDEHFAAGEDRDAVMAEVAALGRIDIAPPLPDLTPASRLLNPAAGSG